ncbi:unnamed protein product [Knipowitschia caucasica]|uniref:Leishmanolysin-like peptidase n=1 Tax=Knipowitschia caucasica TaxID=637954 RepID=A0AAV2KLL1_KNICA
MFLLGEGNEFGSILTCKQNSSFFCSGSGFGCHYLHLHKGQCQSDPYLDGCRIYKPIQNRSECWMVENVPESSQDEMFGSDSRCFVSSLSSQGGVLNTSTVGRCYRHRCTGLNQYQVKVRDSDWVNCPAGGTVQIEGYAGSVWCPDRRLCVPNVSIQSHILGDYSKSQQPIVVGSIWRSPALLSALVLLAPLFLLLLLLLLLLLVNVSVSCRCCKVRVHSLQQEQHMHPTRA